MSSGRQSVKWQMRRATDWSAVAAVWDRVNAAAGAVPFLDSAFIEPLLQHFGAGNETVAIGSVDDQPVAAALLAQSVAGHTTTFQPSQLPLGPWLVAHGLDAVETARSLLLALPGMRIGLGLTQLDPLLQAHPQNTAVLQTFDYIQTAWIDVQGSFGAYWEARGKNLRSNLRKQRNKLDSDGVKVTFDTLRSPDDVNQAVAEYGRLETGGWKGEIGTSVHPDNVQGRFYEAMLRNFCGLGRARIWRLKFDDKVVAMDLCIEGGGTLVVLKTAYDSEYRTLSPAFLMRQQAFEELFNAGDIRRIEFYGRVMEWHTRWSEQSRTLYHANVYRWALVPVLRRLLGRGRGTPDKRNSEAHAGAAS